MKIQITLSTKANADGMSEILLSTSIKRNGKAIRMRAKSGIYTLPSYFDEVMGIDLAKKRIPIERAHHVEAKRKLGELFSKIARAECNADKAAMDKDWLKGVVDRYHHPEKYMTAQDIERSKSIWEKAESYDERNASDHTKQVFKVAIRAMFRYERYLNEIDKREFSWNDIDAISKADIEDFQKYLENEKALMDEHTAFYAGIFAAYPKFMRGGKRDKREKGEQTIRTYLKDIKSFFTSLVESGKANSNPLQGFKFSAYEYAEPIVLTESERNTLAAAAMPTEELELIRDRFIFQCYIGCRMIDLENITDKNLNGGKLEYIPIKTSKSSSRVCKVPLAAYAKSLIKKYRGIDKEERIMPFVDRRKYNKAIKECFKIAHLDRNVNTKDTKHGEPVIKPLYEVATSHLARRSFIGIMYNNGVPLEVIASMSGHVRQSKAIARYYDTNDEQREQGIARLDTTTPKADLKEIFPNLSSEKIAAIKAIIER